MPLAISTISLAVHSWEDVAVAKSGWRRGGVFSAQIKATATAAEACMKGRGCPPAEEGGAAT